MGLSDCLQLCKNNKQEEVLNNLSTMNVMVMIQLHKKTNYELQAHFNFGKTGNNIDIKPICVAPGDNKLDPVAVNGNSLKQETGE